MVLFQQGFKNIVDVHLYFDVSFSHLSTSWFKTGIGRIILVIYLNETIICSEIKFLQVVMDKIFTPKNWYQLTSSTIFFRLFLGLMEINPVFLFISLCISLVLGINSFYYEYSFRTIFGKPCYYSIGQYIFSSSFVLSLQ